MRKIFLSILTLSFYFCSGSDSNVKETVSKVAFVEKITKNSLGMEFVEIPPGEFLMGCSVGDSECDSDEKPLHKITLTKPFLIGKYEVTQAEWKKVMGNNPANFSKCGDTCPIENVSWNDAQEFIQRLCKMEKMNPCHYSLPSEAQWEYAARAGTQTRFYWGNKVRDDYLWYDPNAKDTTHPVGKKKPNAWGLYDMLGNVWEWTGDTYDANYYSKSVAIDPEVQTKTQKYVMRGGSWDHDDQYCRVSDRDFGVPDMDFNTVGFRIIKTQP